MDICRMERDRRYGRWEFSETIFAIVLTLKTIVCFTTQLPHTHTKKDVKIAKVEYKQKQLDLTVIQIHRIAIFSVIVKQNMLTPYHQTAY